MKNAALHCLARLLEAGDLISPCRRLLVIASEDIGMAYPMCAVIVKACVDSALQLGLPEARIPLAQAVVTMATAPKSNSSYMAINQAIADVRAGKIGDFLAAWQNKHFDGAEVENKGQFYKYPHDYPDHYGPPAISAGYFAGNGIFHISVKTKPRMLLAATEKLCFPIWKSAKKNR